MWAVALGLGLGIGALRFGNIIGKVAGSVTLLLLSGILMMVMYRGFMQWKIIFDYWRENW